MKKSIVTFLLSLAFSAFGQYVPNKTKFYFGIEGFGRMNLIIPNSSPVHVYSSGKMVEKKHQFYFGGSFYLMKIVKPKYNIGFECIYRTIGISNNNVLSSYYKGLYLNETQELHIRSEATQLNVISGLIRFDFFNKMGNNPIGMTHSFAFGYSRLFYPKKTYYVSINEFGDSKENEAYWTTPERTNYFKDSKGLNAFTMKYDLGFRYPITPRIACFIGLRTLVNLQLPAKFSTADDQVISNEENAYFNARRVNLFSFNLLGGLNFSI